LRRAIVIGSGFAGLSAASFLAKDGWDVTVVERHAIAGGRARRLTEQGFVFDMGPSWYWMPDVFERYFASFGKASSSYYALQRLDPSYRVYWKDEHWDIPADYDALKTMLEGVEKGGGRQLDAYLRQAACKYKLGIHQLVQKPGQSWLEFLDWDLIRGAFKLEVFTSMRRHIAQFFTNEKIRQLLEFPVLFLGALPKDTPALYSLMNYADIRGGTWYPENGMYSVVEGMQSVAEELGVQFHFNENAIAIRTDTKRATGVATEQSTKGHVTTHYYAADAVIASADYHFVETTLLPPQLRSYSEAYWEKRIMAPSCLLFFVGLKKKLRNILHHSLFFDVDFDHHGAEIYTTKKWPEQPLFYVCAASATDRNAAPAGGENLFFLIPVAAGLSGDTEALREQYFKQIISRFEQRIGESVTDHIVLLKTFGPKDFVDEYHAFKGNAYGLANTLFQTALLKPSCRSKKVRNLYYTGQLTVPGPGVPPSLISGEVVAREVIKHFDT
jgi:phytoene desaturase